MYGWNGKILRVDLTRNKSRVQTYDSKFAATYIGGRGFAAKILWDELPKGVNPLGAENKLVIAAGPLTGFPGPSLCKLIIAAKSPLTGGYGDGNIGTMAAVEMRRAGIDAVVIEGKAAKPVYLYVENRKGQLLSADDLWGKTTFETEEQLRQAHGRNVGVLTIGPSGENLVKYAIVTSQEGRAGGRPGMGAVLGSKRLKAIVFKGTKSVPLADAKSYKRLVKRIYEKIRSRDNYSFWTRQGTMAAIEWSNEIGVLPTHNFQEGIFEFSNLIGGYASEAIKIKRKGCPYCNMQCGTVVLDLEGRESELDYENVAMLGSNIGLGHLGKVSVLNRLADELGIDTISLGNNIGFAMEAGEKGLIEHKVEWGDYEEAKMLIHDIAYREGELGNLFANGVQAASQKLGHDSHRWAMHVKGLEVSAYDCHTVPGMALAFATSPIGAHHKDAWIIAWEIENDRTSYTRAKVEKVIELQRVRGGMFESLVACRFPWTEMGLELELYPRLLKSASGMDIPLKDITHTLADRTYTFIRAFWVREYGENWGRQMDYPPIRWFEEATTQGSSKGAVLDKAKFETLLDMYYVKRGWDNRGIPTKTTLKKLVLLDVAEELSKYVVLSS